MYSHISKDIKLHIFVYGDVMFYRVAACILNDCTLKNLRFVGSDSKNTVLWYVTYCKFFTAQDGDSGCF